MFESHYAQSRTPADGAAATPSTPYEPLRNISAISMLLWGEHCIECGIPECYSSCALYEARPDGRCRRFTFGTERNTNFRGFRTCGYEIKFKQWGKLEARGSYKVFPARFVKIVEASVNALCWPLTCLGQLVYAATRDPRWESLYSALIEKASAFAGRILPGAEPQAFLVEMYNPGDETVIINLEIRPATAQPATHQGLVSIQPRFRVSLPLAPGYSRHTFEYGQIARAVGGTPSIFVSLTPAGDTICTLVLLNCDFVSFSRRTSAELTEERTEQVKCVAWDLDNTLWHGILAEGASVKLREGIPELMRWLDDRGILQSVASKNDYSAAWAELQKLGISDYLLRPKINWLPKSENIRVLAKELNLGLAAFALIDDSVFEREEIRHALGTVTCFDEKFITEMRGHPRFQGAETEEARNRRRFYKEAAVREAESDAHGGDITAFLASCNIVLHICAYAPEHEARAGELVQRTNQLNFSGTKYSAPAFAALVRDEALEKLVLKCSDKFGDYGTIGFAIVRRSMKLIEILDLMLSCRVQGKLLERALFDHLADVEGREGLMIWVNYNQTARNTPARLALDSIGFRPNGRADIHGGTGMLLDDCYSTDNPTVTVVSEVTPRTLMI